MPRVKHCSVCASAMRPHSRLVNRRTGRAFKTYYVCAVCDARRRLRRAQIEAAQRAREPRRSSLASVFSEAIVLRGMCLHANELRAICPCTADCFCQRPNGPCAGTSPAPVSPVPPRPTRTRRIIL